MFSITTAPLEPAPLIEAMRRPQAGALVTFEGWVRDQHQGHAVQRLEYQAYEQMAISEGMQIIQQAGRASEILEARCVHRVGSLQPGDLAVWIGVTAAHRQAAFDACRFIINQVKERVPIWKKEFYRDGHSVWVATAGPGQEADSQ